jgi:hypothetical protein
MKDYLLLIAIPTLCGTIIGMDTFRIMFRHLAKAAHVNRRLTYAIAGACLGAFAGMLLLLAFPSMVKWPQDYMMLTLLAVILSVSVQKLLIRQE